MQKLTNTQRKPKLTCYETRNGFGKHVKRYGNKQVNVIDILEKINSPKCLWVTQT